MSKSRTLLSLQAKLWKRSLAASRQQLAGHIVIAILVFAQCLSLGAASITQYKKDGDATLFVITMALGSFLYFIGSALSPDCESQVEPNQLAILPLQAKDILPGLFFSKFLQTGSIMSIINTLIMSVLGWIAFSENGSVYGILWILSCAGQLVLTLALGEAISLFMSRAGGTKFKERLNIISGVFFMLLAIVAVLAMNALATSENPTQGSNYSVLLPVASWLPFGAFANFAASLADPALAGPPAELALAIGLITLVFAGWLWYIALRNLIRTPIRATGGAKNARRAKKHSIMVPWAPQGQFGAMYSQAVQYYVRDSRQILALVSLPLLAGMYLVLSKVTDQPFLSWASIFLLSMAAGSLLPNSIGMDGPMNWVHLSVGVSAKNYMWSRWCAALTMIGGWIVLFGTILGFLNGFTEVWVLCVVAALLITLLTMSFALLIASNFAAPTPPPTANAFRQKNSGSFAASMLMLLFTILSGIVVLPMVVIFKVLNNMWLAILVELPITVAAVWFIMFIASRRLEKNWVTLFNKVKHWS